MNILANNINKFDLKHYKNNKNEEKISIKKFSQIIKSYLDKTNSNLTNSKQTNPNQSDSLGLYIPHTLNDSSLSYEYIDEVSFMIRNIDRKSDFNNMFKWKNILDNKIKNLLFIYLNMAILPVRPFIQKNILDPTVKVNNIRNNLIDLLTQNKLVIDQDVKIGSKNINIPYFDSDVIEFNINNNYMVLYMINLKTNEMFVFNKSKQSLIHNEFLFLQIDSNDNLNNNFKLDTSYTHRNFMFKLIPLQYTDTNIYYKSVGQHLIKTLNELSNIDNLTIQIYDEKYKPLTNNFINQKLYNSSYNCSCNELGSSVEHMVQPNPSPDSCLKTYSKPSCYCNYIRHPYNQANRIDIAFKIGQIKNEIINDIFY